MKDNYDSIDQALDIEGSIVESTPIKPTPPMQEKDDVKKDYERTRAISESYKQYYPGSKDITYANYLEAMTYYILIA